MAAKYILAVLAVAFLLAGAIRTARDGGTLRPQGRTWFLIGAIFGLVSAYLWVRN